METLPVEIVEQILLNCSTPSFIQFTKTSKKLFHVAKQSRKALALHLCELPGSKDNIRDGCNVGTDLLLLLRQRATENLFGCHWTADLIQCMPLGTSLNPIASWLGSPDSILAFHGHSDLRVYKLSKKGFLLKDWLRRPAGTRLLKIVRTKNLISILEAWPTEDDIEYIKDGSDYVETLNTEKLIPTKQVLLEKETQIEEDIPVEAEDDDVDALPTLSTRATTYTYKLCFFDSESLEQLHTLDLDEETGYVPRDLAVHDMYNCAVLWEDAVVGASKDAHITSFTATDEDLYYNCEVVWPKSEQTATEIPSQVSASTKNQMTKLEAYRTVPARMAYFKDGQRLKIYEAGGLVPREIISLKASIPADNDAVAFNASNLVNFPSSACRIETPFYGTHIQVILDTGYSWERDWCFFHHLCLGVASFKKRETDTTVHTLCILRSQTHGAADRCNHEIRLHDMPHMKTRDGTTVVARLWGWSGDQCLTLTGSDRIATSASGTRIAISAWNKIYVYSLNPKVLCDENVVDECDDERKRRKRKERRGRPYKQWERLVTDYYQRHKDPNFDDWNIVELKPVVIDLEGAIAQQMCWTPMGTQPAHGDEAEVESDEKLPTSPSEETQQGANSSGLGTVNLQQDTEVVTEPQQDVSDMESGIFETDPAIVPDTIGVQASSDDDPIGQAAISPLVSEQEGINEDDERTPMFTPSPLSTTSSSPSLVAEPLGNMTDLAPSLQPLSISEEANALVDTSPRHGKGVESSDSTGVKPGPQDHTSHLSPMLPEQASGFDEAVMSASSIPAANALNEQSSEIMKGELNPYAASKAPSSPPTVAETTSPTIEGKTSGSVHSVPQSPLGDCSASQVSAPTTIFDTINVSAKMPPRQKRITEDELVVLTDKGVQIWNFGARATGKRARTRLALEEGLHRNQAAWKGKGVAMNNE